MLLLQHFRLIRRKESDVLRQNAFDEMEFPLQSYLYLIKIAHQRVIIKHEVSYKVAKKEK